jgi:hypothetical protein
MNLKSQTTSGNKNIKVKVKFILTGLEGAEEL